jgi:hypothetical protein
MAPRADTATLLDTDESTVDIRGKDRRMKSRKFGKFKANQGAFLLLLDISLLV